MARWKKLSVDERFQIKITEQPSFTWKNGSYVNTSEKVLLEFIYKDHKKGDADVLMYSMTQESLNLDKAIHAFDEFMSYTNFVTVMWESRRRV